jgi:transaldolase
MKSQIIAGSVREVKSIIDWLAAGSHIVTAAPQFLSKMIQHPYTAVTVKEFLRDAAATPK